LTAEIAENAEKGDHWITRHGLASGPKLWCLLRVRRASVVLLGSHERSLFLDGRWV